MIDTTNKPKLTSRPLHFQVHIGIVKAYHKNDNGAETWYGLHSKNIPGRAYCITQYASGDSIVVALNGDDAENYPCMVNGPAYDMTIGKAVAAGLLNARDLLVTA